MINALSNRSGYPCLSQNIYLNQASLGLLSDKTVTEMTKFLDTVARYGNLKMTDEEEAHFLNPLRRNVATLLQAKQKNIAIVKADGSIQSSDIVGSIHKIGAHHQGTESCNGWTYWHFIKGNNLLPIDTLREEIRSGLNSLS